MHVKLHASSLCGLYFRQSDAWTHLAREYSAAKHACQCLSGVFLGDSVRVFMHDSVFDFVSLHTQHVRQGYNARPLNLFWILYVCCKGCDHRSCNVEAPECNVSHNALLKFDGKHRDFLHVVGLGHGARGGSADGVFCSVCTQAQCHVIPLVSPCAYCFHGIQYNRIKPCERLRWVPIKSFCGVVVEGGLGAYVPRVIYVDGQKVLDVLTPPDPVKFARLQLCKQRCSFNPAWLMNCGHPFESSTAYCEIKQILAQNGLGAAKYLELVKNGILKRTKHGNSDYQTRKCLHKLRKLANGTTPTEYAPLQVNVPNIASESILPTAAEFKAAQLLCPDIEYGELSAKMAKVTCVLASAPSDRVAPMPSITCSNPSCSSGDTALVFDACCADTICADCGMVAVQQDAYAWQTYAPVNVPMYSEPIAGVINAQKKCDALSGVDGSSTSAYTKHIDAQQAKEWYDCQFPSAIAKEAHKIYGKYRQETGHVQQRDAVIMACGLLAGRALSAAR